ncbi:MAG: DUF3592 domain-containing protein [Candidatus Hodarchaeota archaeon]
MNWIPIVLFIISFLIVLIDLVYIFKVGRTSSWPTAKGTVNQSEIIENYINPRAVSYQAAVRYSYTVNGEPYENDQLRAKISKSVKYYGGSMASASKITEQFREGARIPVHYNPRDPADSVIIPGFSSLKAIIAFIIAFFFFDIGMLLIGGPLFQVFLFILKIFAVALGISILAVDFRYAARVSASKKWPTVNGEIIVSELSQVFLSLHILFRYEINELEYFSNRIKLWGSGPMMWHSSHHHSNYWQRRRYFRKLQRIAEKYPEGKEVLVFYDPKSPTEAILEPGIDAFIFCIFLLMGFMFGIFPLLFL